ncbi:MAG TPA: protein phosphatase 2C domain-containing protein [Kofleriaceae bacterium]|nr:protein phosphatase 2C domain-containing protein [Kofleriaceae bacterium]
MREHNEDCAYSEKAKGFFIVADGMGGHAAGEVASEMAVATVRKALEDSLPEIDAFKRAPTDAGRRGIVQLLQSAVLSAHQAVFQRGQNEADKAGMGTTLDVVLVAGPEAFVAHVGDSRTYLVRDGRSSQITTDHTVAEVLVIEGKLTIEEAQVSPLRTILVNAIGVSADVGVEMAHVTLKRGDRLLLCSDGLHDYFPLEEEIAQKLSAAAPGDALKDMVELAKTRGGHDNITGVAVEVIEVIEAVPGAIDSDLTHPVDLHGTNPFASDEPTETAYVELPPISGRTLTSSSRMPSQLKSTQPMRIIEDDDASDVATADTIPPGVAAKLVPPPAVALKAKPELPVAKAAGNAGATSRAEAKPAAPETKLDPDAKTDPVIKPLPEAKAEVTPAPKAEATHDPKAGVPASDAAKPSDTKPGDPGELSSADTGPLRTPTPSKDDKDAG